MEKMNEIINDVVKKIKEDDGFAERFKSNPVETVKSFVNVSLSEDDLKNIIDLVKTKISADDLKDKLSDIEGKIKGLI